MTMVAMVLAAAATVALAAADDVAPSASQEAIYRALSIRHPVPGCEAVEGLSETPVEDLLFVVEHAVQPPWVALRATECLVERHGEAVKPQIDAWVAAEETRGLALVVLNGIDRLPVAVGLDVGRAALSGPLREDARERLGRAESAEIRALVAP